MADKLGSAKEANSAELVNTSARRRFLNKAGKVAVTTSAVTLMLSVGSKQGLAVPIGSFPKDFNQWH